MQYMIIPMFIYDIVLGGHFKVSPFFRVQTTGGKHQNQDVDLIISWSQNIDS